LVIGDWYELLHCVAHQAPNYDEKIVNMIH